MRHDVSTFLPLPKDAYAILLTLQRGPLHGYGIILAAESASGGEMALKTGPLYRSLKQLLANGLIEETHPPRDADSDDERRRYYRTTSLGAAVLRAEVSRLDRLVRAARAQGVRPGPRLA